MRSTTSNPFALQGIFLLMHRTLFNFSRLTITTQPFLIKVNLPLRPHLVAFALPLRALCPVHREHSLATTETQDLVKALLPRLQKLQSLNITHRGGAPLHPLDLRYHLLCFLKVMDAPKYL